MDHSILFPTRSKRQPLIVIDCFGWVHDDVKQLYFSNLTELSKVMIFISVVLNELTQQTIQANTKYLFTTNLLIEYLNDVFIYMFKLIN